MTETATNYKTTRRIIKSFRLTETHWELIKQECAMRNMPFSAYVRLAILGNLKYVRRQAIEAWGR